MSLFRNGSNQAVRIPCDFELPEQEAFLMQEDGRLILEPLPEKVSLLEYLDTLEPFEEDFPDVDEGLKYPKAVEL